jgi:hypothetical protein
MQGLLKGGEEKAMEWAGRRWYGNRRRPGDCSKAYNQLLWPDGDCLNREFQSLAERVFAPLLEHLEWA